jgi:hypothetical protein
MSPQRSRRDRGLEGRVSHFFERGSLYLLSVVCEQGRPEDERRLKATEQAYKKLEDDYVAMKECHPTVVVIFDAHDMPVSASCSLDIAYRLT